MYRFAIVRILGNENPPRDSVGSRLKSLKFILDNEPSFSDTVKLYVVNRIVDDEFKSEIINLLREYDANFIELPIAWNKLVSSPEIDDANLNLEIIGINHARNKAIDLGHKFADFSIVFDGDCLFDSCGWNLFQAAVAERCKQHYRYYFSIPTIRTTIEAYDKPKVTNYTEPMPVFHRDSLERFNEHLLFGQCDKLELLFRLGHDMTPDTDHCKIIDGKTSLAGYCCHLQTGDDAVETILGHRMYMRDLSLKALWQKVRDKVKLLSNQVAP